MRNHRICRSSGLEAAAPPGAEAPRVPGVRLRGDRAARGRRARLTRAPSGRSTTWLQPPGRTARSRPRARSHALGDARRRHRGERPSADCLRREEARDRDERDRRELPRAARGVARGGPHVHVRDRRGDDRPSARGRVRRRPRRRGSHGVSEARGPLHVRPHPSRSSEPSGRRSSPDADGGRDRRRRELPRLQPRCVPRRDPQSAVPRRRRDRLDHARSRRDHRRDDRRARSSTTSSRSTGTTKSPSVPATRRSC